MVTSPMCISSTHCFMTSTGHGEPAIIPVRSDDRSKVWKSGWASMAMNIVGTPSTLVHRSASIACSVASGSNDGAGSTVVVAWVRLARLPMTMPKQW